MFRNVFFVSNRRNLRMTTMFNLNTWHCAFYPFPGTFNVIERPYNELQPVSAYIIAAINSYSINRLFSFFSLEVNKTKKKKRSYTRYWETWMSWRSHWYGALTLTTPFVIAKQTSPHTFSIQFPVLLSKQSDSLFKQAHYHKPVICLAAVTEKMNRQLQEFTFLFMENALIILSPGFFFFSVAYIIMASTCFKQERDIRWRGEQQAHIRLSDNAPYQLGIDTTSHTNTHTDRCVHTGS